MMQENAAAGRKSAIAPRPYRELRRRLVSGLFLGLLALALLLAGPRPFALLVLFVALMMSWEWGRVVRSKRLDISFLVHSSAACSAAVLAAVGQPIFGLAAVLIGAVCLIILNFGKPAYLSILGVAYVGFRPSR
jgi:CDP-diglyceride synthetase